jgi:hypothetical protein
MGVMGAELRSADSVSGSEPTVAQGKCVDRAGLDFEDSFGGIEVLGAPLFS